MSQLSINGEIKAMNMVHKAMLLSLLLFGSVAIYLVQSGSIEQGLHPYDHVLQLLSIALSFGGFFIGNAIFKKRVKEQQGASNTPAAKVAAYRTAALFQWALLDGPAVFSIICFMLVGNFAFMAMALVFTVFLAVVGPNKIKMMLLLGLKEEDFS